MAQGNNSIKKVLIVAFSLCIVCSVIVSTAAVALRPAQQLNQELDRKTNILNVAAPRSPPVLLNWKPESTPTSSTPTPMTVLKLHAIRPLAVRCLANVTSRDSRA